MRAAVCPEYGPPEVVRIEERPVPEPGTGEARVRVRAAAVNFPDVLLVANEYQISVPPPFVPGSEFAGEVVALGPGRGPIAIGDRVCGTGLHGAFAEQIAVPAGKLTHVPEGVDFADAAAFGVTYRTAYHCIRSVARVSAGAELIVLGAGGGVGSAAVALGARLGLSVTAVASSPAKLEVARSLGAAHLIDHRGGNLRDGLRAALPGGADAVIDPVGGELSEPALRSLRRGGRFVTVGYAAGTVPRIPLNLVLVKGIHVLGFQFQDIDRAEFDRNERELGRLLADGLRPHIGARFALSDSTAALRLVADGHAVGKVVIDIDEDGDRAGG
ncbi:MULTISPECIES: NADPH:quinone oxidoreductase family protein [Nocardia]|uniref:NADPH:quinone oxidoreductase family protein n=1 Tax=Nocardia TaxID=1817 RepID=UPI0007EA0A41|nr:MULTISPECIES: NADPH:quinone oxidoreductase family protein [Nocardia]MBF6273006.1 NADPH:quinone oxidoreductase family protein [Nocardia nova]OBA41311.1 NADPH:quinone oxidoreductase [Nocardia sp. 852002-51101_SCH5132738]OBB42065.1 NADPH:quinone oxidoreductase [Nocardia sp. 852002-51244_SCH5132740]OBF63707.1 NADPH:quinone oxidoreductase [Mycobacterium sp. 852002-51759_SCH5129042]